MGNKVFSVAVVLLSCGALASAAGDSRRLGPRTLNSGLDGPERNNVNAQLSAVVLSVRVEHIRLDPASTKIPATLLTFDLVNGGPNRLTSLVLQVSVVGRPGDAAAKRRVLVQPFTIRGNAALDPGYAVRYELLLRNFSSDGSCVAIVDVLSASP